MSTRTTLSFLTYLLTYLLSISSISYNLPELSRQFQAEDPNTEVIPTREGTSQSKASILPEEGVQLFPKQTIY